MTDTDTHIIVRVSAQDAAAVTEWWGDTYPATWLKQDDGSIEARMPRANLPRLRKWLHEHCVGEGRAPALVVEAIDRAVADGMEAS